MEPAPGAMALNSYLDIPSGFPLSSGDSFALQFHAGIGVNFTVVEGLLGHRAIAALQGPSSVPEPTAAVDPQVCRHRTCRMAQAPVAVAQGWSWRLEGRGVSSSPFAKVARPLQIRKLSAGWLLQADQTLRLRLIDPCSSACCGLSMLVRTLPILRWVVWKWGGWLLVMICRR